MAIPFFTVVVPMHNNSETITLTLKSLLSQDFPNFEVIFIDDASDDFLETKKIISNTLLNKLPFKIYNYKENKNGAAARNLGVANANGLYIAFLDADDEWLPSKLSTYYHVIQKTDSGYEKKIFYSKLKIKDTATGNILDIRPENGFNKELDISVAQYLFSFDGFIQTSTIVAHRSIFDKINFNEKFIRHQDYDFCINCDYHGIQFYFISEVLTIYNKFNASTINTSNGNKESESYSLFWLREMRTLMSFRDRCAYRAYILPSRCRMDNKKIKANLYAILNIPFTSLRAIKLKLLNKIRMG